MGRAIAKIDAFEVPEQPKTTFNVGRVGGGTSVNAIPFEAWMEVDMRSADPAALKAVDTKFKRRINQAVAEENARWNNRGPVSVSAELVGVRPAGQTPKESPIVQTAHGRLPRHADRRGTARRLHRFQRADEFGHPRDHHQRRRRGHRRAFAE